MIGTQHDRNATIRGYTGKLIHVFDLQPDEIILEDLAHSLSFICRFAGRTEKFYSVAQHEAILADLFLQQGEIELAKYALHHDDAESIQGADLPTPFKYLDGMAECRAIERRNQKRIYHKFGLIGYKGELIEECGEPVLVKQLDGKLVCNEARDLLRITPEWAKGNYIRNLRIDPWSSKKAEKEYLKMHERLFNEKTETK